MRLWTPSEAQPTQGLMGHKGAAVALAMNPQGRFLASAAEDKTVRLWRIDGAKRVGRLGGLGQPTALSFSPDGAILAVGNAGGEIALVDVASGR